MSIEHSPDSKIALAPTVEKAMPFCLSGAGGAETSFKVIMKNLVVLALAASVLACGTGSASEAKTDLYKHFGVAYASSTACNFFEMPDGFEVTEKRMGIKLLEAQESPIWRAAYDKQLAKLNKAKPRAKAAECARVYKLYGPRANRHSGFSSALMCDS